VAGQAVSDRKPLKFFVLTFSFSWLFWIPAALIEGDILGSPWVALLYLGGLGPAAAGIILSHIGRSASARKEYWSRVFDFKRIDGWWILIILFSYPLISAITTFLVQGKIQLSDSFQNALAHPAQLVPFLVFLYLFGPFPEELGWRGYALDGLQEKLNPVSSSLLLGSCWAIWHIPLFLMGGTYQHELGFGSLEFWIFMLSAVVVSIFYTWIYNHNQRSILAASLFHFSINLTGNLFYDIQTTRMVRLGVMVAVAVGVIFFTRTKGLLGYSEDSDGPPIPFGSTPL